MHAVVEAGVLRVWQVEQRGDDVEVPEEAVPGVLDAPEATCSCSGLSTFGGEDVELVGLLYTEGIEAGEVGEAPGPHGGAEGLRLWRAHAPKMTWHRAVAGAACGPTRRRCEDEENGVVADQGRDEVLTSGGGEVGGEDRRLCDGLIAAPVDGCCVKASLTQRAGETCRSREQLDALRVAADAAQGSHTGKRPAHCCISSGIRRFIIAGNGGGRLVLPGWRKRSCLRARLQAVRTMAAWARTDVEATATTLAVRGLVAALEAEREADVRPV